jgi:predicted SnoaL-like aldol condensation-catalyzing enzyme
MNKESAVHFLQLVLAGKIDEAYQEHVNMSGKHHNLFIPAGFPSLQKAMKEHEVQFPHKKMTMKHVLGDGDLVAVHSHLIVEPQKTELIVVHLFRFEGGKIVEMWDRGQIVPADSPNQDGLM